MLSKLLIKYFTCYKSNKINDINAEIHNDIYSKRIIKCYHQNNNN